jgi:NADPH-dependent ferric siderophore reductase
VHRVHRDGAPAATTAHLADALRGLPWPEGPGQAWGAAESRVAREIRTVLHEERGMPRSHARARGYWLRSGDWLDDEG